MRAYLSRHRSTQSGAAGAGNVISGNATDGVYLGGSNNFVQGNLIGTNASGTASVANGTANSFFAGVYIDNSPNNTIGGTSAGARNIISGNGTTQAPVAYGVFITGSNASNNVVAGNFVGTDITGTQALGNRRTGVAIIAAPNNVIGGTAAGAGNVISANGESGVYVEYSQSFGNQIQGNLIGTNYQGTGTLGGNPIGGVVLDGAPNNTVGGVTSAARNIISGNAGPGALIFDQNNLHTATGNTISGNFIGTDISGAQPLGNAGTGVQILSGAVNNTVGGTSAGARNVISGNAPYGVELDGNSNLVEGNFIGTNAAGTAAVGNITFGVYINGGANNTIGGLTTTPGTGAGNVISGNRNSNGVVINGVTATGNLIEGNLVGLNAAGTASLTNGNGGVYLRGGTSHNTIGGVLAGARNVISGNNASGVDLSDAGTSFNTVAGNFIGTDITGTVAQGNGTVGVSIEGGSQNNLIGADGSNAVADLAARNVIAANKYGGVAIFGVGAQQQCGSRQLYRGRCHGSRSPRQRRHGGRRWRIDLWQCQQQSRRHQRRRERQRRRAQRHRRQRGQWR